MGGDDSLSVGCLLMTNEFHQSSSAAVRDIHLIIYRKTMFLYSIGSWDMLMVHCACNRIAVGLFI